MRVIRIIEQVTSLVLVLLINCELVDNNKQIIPLIDYGNLVIELRKVLYTGCVTSLYTSDDSSIPGLLESKELIKFEKHLAQHGIQSSLLNLDKLVLNDKLQCYNTPSLFVILRTNEKTRDVLKRLANNGNVSMSSPRWLLFLDETYSIDDFFVNINIPFDCRFIVAQQHIDNIINLTEVYRVSRSFPLETFQYGDWSSTGGLHWTTSQLYERRNNLRGLEIQATSIDVPPITMLIDVEDDNHPIRVDGYFGRVWSLLEERLNFTTNYTKSKDNAWGTNEPITGWNGMIRMILDKEVDVAVTEFWITEERSEVIDYTLPLLLTRYRVIGQNPTYLTSVSVSDILAPFSASLWLTIACCIVVIATQLSILHYLGRRVGNEEADGPLYYTFYNSMHYIFGVFCHQGHNTTPRAPSCRIVYLLSYLAAVVLLSSYSAALISYLTYREVKLPFTDLKGLLDDGNYNLAVLHKSAEYNIFRTSDNEEMQELFKKHIAPDTNSLPTTAHEGLIRVCNDSQYMFFVSFDIALGAYALGQVTCDLTLLPDVSMFAGLSIAMAKKNAYKGIINYNLQAMRDNGILQRLRALFWPSSMPTQNKSHMQVYLVNVAPIFSILLVGIMLAVTFLFAERWYHLFTYKNKALINSNINSEHIQTATVSDFKFK